MSSSSAAASPARWRSRSRVTVSPVTIGRLLLVGRLVSVDELAYGVRAQEFPEQDEASVCVFPDGACDDENVRLFDRYTSKHVGGCDLGRRGGHVRVLVADDRRIPHSL